MQALEDLIVENANLIYKIANMFRNSGCDMDDLKQAGKLGFIMAYQNYKPDFNTKFTTYAIPYIYGEISKYVRDNKGIKISRDITKLYYKIEKARILLMQELCHEPTTKELSNYLGIDENIIIDSVLSKSVINSIDDKVSNNDNDLTYHEVIPAKIQNIDDKLLLEDALHKLSSDEYKLIYDRYYGDITQTEIATMLGTSQVQVSRKEQKVMKKLRNYMTC